MPFCSSSCCALAWGAHPVSIPHSISKPTSIIRFFIRTLDDRLTPRMAALHHGVKKNLLLFEPCIAVWHIVHAWYFCAWLWNVGVAGAPASAENAWHSRHSRFTCARFKSLGFEDPCGMWHAAHPSIF